LIVNLTERVVEVCRAPRDGRYEDVTRHERDETLRLAAFPDVAVAIGQFLSQ
jgi:hypothetical protein